MRDNHDLSLRRKMPPLSEVEVKRLLNDESAYKTWVIMSIATLNNEVAWFKKIISPAFLLAILASAGTLVDLMIRLSGR